MFQSLIAGVCVHTRVFVNRNQIFELSGVESLNKRQRHSPTRSEGGSRADRRFADCRGEGVAFFNFLED